MRGVRRRPPPHGWDDTHPDPGPGWKERKRLGGHAADDELRAPSPAMRFLNPSRFTASPEPIPEPIPPSKSHRAPRERQRAASQRRPTDATARIRMRALRERRANGRIPVTVTVSEIDWAVALAEGGFLTDPDPDKAALGQALSTMLDRLLHADLNTLLLRRNAP